MVAPGIVVFGTLPLFGFEPCCKFPGVVVRGTAFGSVGVAGTVDGRVVLLGDVVLPGNVVLLGDVVLLGVDTPGVDTPGVDTLLGTVLDGTVDGCVVLLGTVVDDGCVTVLPGFTAPGRSDGCTVAPGTVFGCVVLLG